MKTLSSHLKIGQFLNCSVANTELKLMTVPRCLSAEADVIL